MGTQFEAKRTIINLITALIFKNILGFMMAVREKKKNLWYSEVDFHDILV